ncbi:MAG: redox-regulated ATPase YchF [Patescibacteria group bacterium]
MSLKAGIVGLPNVGKSTLFAALTKKKVEIANYPFVTIDPNVGVVEVPDERLAKLAEVVKTKKIIPAVVEFVDIAGLVKGAHEGKGLGNKFLAHIREVDLIIEVVRTFEDPNIIHVEGSVDPERDKTIIKEELAHANLSEKPILTVYNGIKQNGQFRNIEIPTYRDGIWIDLTKEYEKPGEGLSYLISATYELLGLISFFTAGPKEARAWTIPKGSTAKRAGRAIHSDFEEKFIRAVVIFWKDLVESESYQVARAKGLLRTEGKDYIVQDGDVIEFRHGV